MTKNNKNNRYHCWACLINVSKSSKAVVCKVCMKGFHFKCTDLSAEEFTKIGKNSLKWAFISFLSNDISNGEVEEAETIHVEVIQEINSLSEVIKILNKDLTSANKEKQNLRSHSVLLENLVLKKQETILILERQLESSINSKNGSLKSKILSRSDKRQSMQATFNTPTGRSSIKPDNRGWSSEINEIENFSTVVRNKKTNVIGF